MKLNMGLLKAQLLTLMGAQALSGAELGMFSGNGYGSGSGGGRPHPKTFGGKRQWKARKARNHGNGKGRSA